MTYILISELNNYESKIQKPVISNRLYRNFIEITSKENEKNRTNDRELMLKISVLWI